MIEHENSRLIGELIGEMRGVRLEIAHLNNTVAANTDATHGRMSLIEQEVRELKLSKAIALAHVKGGAWTVGAAIVLVTTGAYTFIKLIIGALGGIKI
jgi:hypothetical protein